MHAKLEQVIRISVAVVLGGIGAAAGFTHTHDWAASNGQTGWLAWATAVVIEGVAVVAGFEIHHHRAAGRPYTFPVVVLVFGVLVQMTAQVAGAKPSPAGWLVAAMPALGFLAVVKLLMGRVAEPPTAETSPTGPAQVVAPTPIPVQDTAAVPRVKLPADITARINAAVAAARDEGREPSIEDIQRVARVPADLARRVLTESTTVNGHHITD